MSGGAQATFLGKTEPHAARPGSTAASNADEYRPASALTAKKMTYEQAHAECKKQIDADPLARKRGERHDLGVACLKKYGFRLKKKI